MLDDLLNYRKAVSGIQLIFRDEINIGLTISANRRMKKASKLTIIVKYLCKFYLLREALC